MFKSDVFNTSIDERGRICRSSVRLFGIVEVALKRRKFDMEVRMNLDLIWLFVGTIRDLLIYILVLLVLFDAAGQGTSDVHTYRSRVCMSTSPIRTGNKSQSKSRSGINRTSGFRRVSTPSPLSVPTFFLLPFAQQFIRKSHPTDNNLNLLLLSLLLWWFGLWVD